MKKIYTIFPIAILALLLTGSPQSASAHGHTSFEINEKVYSFTVGSLNEPVAVDDKSGFDLRVVRTAHHEEGEAEHAGTPVEGLDKTLKVELIAGDKKRILDISPAFGNPGSYRALFIPTVQTTFSYRLFGTIDNVPFDYTWECNPAGHPQSPEDTTEVEVSEGVTRIEKAGAFGCPVPRADLGFPESSATLYELKSNISQAQDQARTSQSKGMGGIVLGALGLVVGIGAWIKKGK